MDVEDTKEDQSVFAFEQRNADFINKEISFFIDNLRKVK